MGQAKGGHNTPFPLSPKPPICPRIMAQKKPNPNYKVIAEHRRARYDYAIEDDIECGIMLQGSEVKSLRVGQSNIAESYAAVEGGELWLVNAYIAPYAQAKTWGHVERRRRKLLVSKRELSRLWSATQREGMTLVPLVMYFNHVGQVKVKLGHCQGQKDTRQTPYGSKTRLEPPKAAVAAPRLGQFLLKLKQNPLSNENCCNGGGSGIRTLGTLSRTSVFKTGALNHSAKPPLFSYLWV